MKCEFYAVAGLVAAAAILAGCHSDHSETQGSLTATALNLPVPGRIRDISAIDPANVTATAIVNGVPVVLQRSNTGSYSGDVQVPQESSIALEIEFSEQFGGESLLLATRTEQVTTGTTDQRLNLRRAGYNFALHDADGDSVSNIVEREENTDPFDGTDAPSMINVTVIAERPAALGTNFDQFVFEGSVGSNAKALSPSGGNFTGDFFVVDRAPMNATVQMIETVTDDQLAVATQTRQLTTVADQQSIVFESGVYSTTDSDSDGRSDLAELVAGSDINTPDNTPETPDTPPPVADVVLITQFNSPSFILNAQTVFAEYRIDNQLVSLTRNSNSFSATSNVAPGSTVNLEVTLLDNFNNQPYELVTAQKSVIVDNSAQQAVSFIESDFVFNLDNDNDGSLNFQEREAGTDPFNPPVVIPPSPVVCNVSPLPVVTGNPGQFVTLSNISSFIDCGDDSYVLNGSSFSFTWSDDADNIGWLIPQDSEGGTSFSFEVEVANPEVATDVYSTFVVNSGVEEETSCTDSTRTVAFTAAEDIFLQNNRIFNNDELRVNAVNRRALIGFDVPAQEGELTAAALVLTVGDDDGNGTVSVFQDDDYQWSETSTNLVFPTLTTLVGSRDGIWQIGSTVSVGLDALFVSGPRVNLFLQQESGGNDVAFTSRETGSPAVLELQYAGCF